MTKMATVQEELFLMIYKLMEKKHSEIFREPVDAGLLPDYHKKIKKPTDISTIIQRLKGSHYQGSWQIKQEFKLMISNCRLYNRGSEDVLRIARKFQRSIHTQWANLEKECQAKALNLSQPLLITQSVLHTFAAIEQRCKRRYSLQLEKLQGLASDHHKVPVFQLPPLELPPQQPKRGQLPVRLHYRESKYFKMAENEKQRLLHFSVECRQLSAVFQQVAQKRLSKYSQILVTQIGWIQNKIFRKCLENKKFGSLSTVQHILQYSANGRLTASLQPTTLQIYLRMVATWLQQYPNILSNYMMAKFIETSRKIKCIITRLIRFKNMSDASPAHFNEANETNCLKLTPSPDLALTQEVPQNDSKRYYIEIRNFRRMLAKDAVITDRKYTKITIKREDDRCFVCDRSGKEIIMKSKSPGFVWDSNDCPEGPIELERQKKTEERHKDEQFLATFNTFNSIQFINNYRDKLEFDWGALFLSKMPPVLQFHPLLTF